MTDTPKINLDVDVDGNKIYEDACSPFTHPVAQTLGLLPRTIKAALAPLEKWILHREYAVKEVEALLEKKLQNVEPEKIITPEPYVAIPAIQATSYSMDNEEIRDMYASLLSKAMNTDFKDDVHPAFVDIVSQLSPADSQFFRYISNASQIPVCKVRHQNRFLSINTLSMLNIKDDDKHNSTLFTDMEYLGKDLGSGFLNVNLDNLSNQQISLSLSNLLRLGIISTNYGSAMEQSNYCPFAQLPEIKSLLEHYPSDKEYETVIVMGTCELTPLGKQFATICIDD